MQNSRILLTTVLKNVSRAFYLSMRVLPDGVRQPISVGYLLARAADTIADTPGLAVEERLRRLNVLRSLVATLRYENVAEADGLRGWSEGATEGEKRLLDVIPQVLQVALLLPGDDRRAVQKVVDTLISGMVLDLSSFPGSFQMDAQLDEYTYLVAGCVGEFWSLIIARHTRALRAWDCRHWSKIGIRFGKALQLTNVLRDAVKDLENGRCYLPGLVGAEWLTWAREHDNDFYAAAMEQLNHSSQRTIFDYWLKVALEHYGAAIEYTLSLPWYCWRLRLAVIWPIAIGLATLAKLSVAPNWLQKGCRVKVDRSWVYRMLFISLPISLCSPVLRWWLNKWWSRANSTIKKEPRFS